MLLIALFACTEADPASTNGVATVTHGAGVAPGPSAARVLAGPDELSGVELPPASRPPADLDRRDVAVEGSWEVARTVGGVDELWTALPTRGNPWPTREAPLDLALNDRAGKTLPFQAFDVAQPRAGTWAVDGGKLLVRVPAGGAPPKGLRLACERAWEKERGLSFSTAGLDAGSFALRTVRPGKESRKGLLLPAPAAASWRVDVPAAATLAFEATVLPPEVASGPVSDGATVVVTAEGGGAPVELGRIAVTPGAWQDARLDLGALAGKSVQIRFQTEGGGSDALDYVFLSAPRVYPKDRKPRRAVLVFVDTLRADHLGLYGYERPTSPNLDAWGKDAVVFTQARTVAPWTLPSSRAMLGGRKPEDWGAHPAFPELFAARGFVPLAVVTNHLLTEGFGMNGGWAEHHYLGDVLAEESIDQALALLESHADQDVAMLVHLMDPHLPYREPAPFRKTWAGADPPGFETAVTRNEVDPLKVHKMPPEKAAPIKQYLVDRYDQEILYTDSQLARLFAALGPDDVVMVVADHGEEFWDHGGFEHGHTLYDELLHVPMLVKAPGLAPGRDDTPVSLVDVLPTMLDLVGAPEPSLEGHPLGPVARKDERARAALVARPQVFGRKYYGRDRWGVLTNGRKWLTTEGLHELYDLAADPGEHANLAPATPMEELDGYRQALAKGLGRDVPWVWRLFTNPYGPRVDEEVRFRVEHPAGIAKAWRGYDWKGSKSEFVVDIAVQDGVAEFVQPPGQAAPSELFVLPNGDPRDPRGLKVTVDVGGKPVEAAFAMDRKPPPVKADQAAVYAKPFNGDVRWALDLAITPVMEATTTSDFNPDSIEQLRALGYVQ